MQLEYKNKKIQRVCEDQKTAIRRHGIEIASLLQVRLEQLKAYASVEDMVKAGVGGIHALSGNRQGQYAMHLKHPHRLILIKALSPGTIRIIEITDYH